ncbi:TNF receptor-associated factor 1 [Bombina bombina]|uniref:TNF receptor-associated factor 1 n=1 Tax=Bombina bombina TaxID=8345 RepID=UPI00235A8EDE|nr:TNF receptor-associated factor 1 [Bombina bombina]
MAKHAIAVKEIPCSTPDENQFVCGYPTNICDNTPGNKYLCCNCHNVLKKAQQTLCGHRYCAPCLSWLVRHHKRPICLKCLQEDKTLIGDDSLIKEEQAFSDAAINKEISELKVHCVTPGCSWSGVMKDYDQNYNSGESSGKESCRYSEVGCSYQGNRDRLKEHEHSSTAAHLGMILPFVSQIKPRLSNGEPTANGFHKRPPEKSYMGLCIGEYEELDSDCNDEAPLYNGPMTPGLMSRVDELESRMQVFENIISVLNREMDNTSAQLAVVQEQKAAEQRKVKSLEQKVTSLECSLAIKEIAYNELLNRQQYLEQTSYDGIFLWRISEVKMKCHDALTGKAISLYSPAFFTARYGYKVCLRIYLNGDGAGKGSHVSLFFTVMRGDYDNLLPWPFKHKVTFMLLDQSNREHVIDAFRPDIVSASFQRPVSEMNVASGCPLFCPITKLVSHKHNYIKDDTMFIRCIIDTIS